jgi:hypothetical protein
MERSRFKIGLLNGALLMNFAQLNLEDQYAKKVEWELFNKLPVVLVLAGEKAASHAHEWGAWLQEHFNGTYVPSRDHLSTADSRERVKVIPVATLPSIPSIFRRLFRNGFRKKTEMAMILDYGSVLSSQFSYQDKDSLPLIAVFAKDAKNTEEAQVFKGLLSDQELKNRLKEKINAQVPSI